MKIDTSIQAIVRFFLSSLIGSNDDITDGRDL
jgi:hypothetical protein